MSYSLVVILELNSVSEVQYKGIMITDNKKCYDSELKVLSKELTLVLSDTRELNRVPNTK